VPPSERGPTVVALPGWRDRPGSRLKKPPSARHRRDSHRDQYPSACGRCRIVRQSTLPKTQRAKMTSVTTLIDFPVDIC
jgi:hypothetical protein